MIDRVIQLLPWRPTNIDAARGRLERMGKDAAPASFADLITAYRALLSDLRPRSGVSTQMVPRIDGLIVAVLLLDGWLDATSDMSLGRTPRLPSDELAEIKVTDSHFQLRTVDFAWRRFSERYGRRIRDLLQGAGLLGKPWLGGMKYRFAIARIEQILRAIQVDPAIAYQGGPKMAGMAAGRIVWRTLTGRR